MGLIIIVGIIVAFFIWYNIWYNKFIVVPLEEKVDAKDRDTRRQFENKRSRVYDSPQVVTGDYYKTNSNYQLEGSTTCICFNTSNCAFCSRRKENKEVNGFSYSPSYQCYEMHDYDY